MSHEQRRAENPLINMSANCSSEDTNWTNNTYLATRSLTKGTSISICFVLWCIIGLHVRAIAKRLSQYSVGVPEIRTCKNCNNCLIQSISAVVVNSAWYSASMEEREIVLCFFEDHEMGFEPRKTTRPVVNLLSLGSSAQSTSVNACKSNLHLV